MANRIFISYKRVDSDKVFALKDRIEAETGELCWIDLEGIESSAQFISTIRQAIDACDIMIFTYSKTHTQITDPDDDWTLKELCYAKAVEKRIVYVNLDGSPLVGDFLFYLGADKQRVDARSEEALCKLFADIREWLKQTPPPPPTLIQKIKKYHQRICFFIKEQKRNVAWLLVLLLSVLLLYLFVRHTSSAPSLPDPSEYEADTLVAIDLGLPSGTLWANMNVGAKQPSDYGLYFAWGEPKSKFNYTQETYHDPQRSNIYYISGDSLYDAATAQMGPGWMMPDARQFRELIDHCSWKLDTRSNVAGILGTSNANGRKIFFPFAGREEYDDIRYRETTGYYWTTDLSDSDLAKNIVFVTDSTPSVQAAKLYIGRSIRAVRKKRSNALYINKQYQHVVDSIVSAQGDSLNACGAVGLLIETRSGRVVADYKMNNSFTKESKVYVGELLQPFSLIAALKHSPEMLQAGTVSKRIAESKGVAPFVSGSSLKDSADLLAYYDSIGLPYEYLPAATNDFSFLANGHGIKLTPISIAEFYARIEARDECFGLSVAAMDTIRRGLLRSVEDGSAFGFASSINVKISGNTGDDYQYFGGRQHYIISFVGTFRTAREQYTCLVMFLDPKEACAAEDCGGRVKMIAEEISRLESK